MRELPIRLPLLSLFFISLLQFILCTGYWKPSSSGAVFVQLKKKGQEGFLFPAPRRANQNVSASKPNMYTISINPRDELKCSYAKDSTGNQQINFLLEHPEHPPLCFTCTKPTKFRPGQKYQIAPNEWFAMYEFVFVSF